tara:strand:- start:323 stop:559 length:237 start_codon:yes stop_codon:yes gene_type:complete
VPRFLLLILLTGCVAHHDPQPADTKFDESKRDWVEAYQHEIKVAIENEDIDAYHFFMQELIKEKVRLWKENHKKSLDK